MADRELLEITQNGDITVVGFNMATISSVSGISEISSKVRDYITENKPKIMLIDFDGVKFFSSQMLGVLVDVWRRLKEYDGMVRISGIDAQLSRVFRITNLDKIFEFYPDRKTAQEAMTEKDKDDRSGKA